MFNIWGKLIWQGYIRLPSSNSPSVPDAMIIDASDSIVIFIWEEHFTKFKEISFYYITNLKKRNFNVTSLATQQFTEFSESEPFEIVDSCNEKIVYCPEIINESVIYTTFAIIQILAKTICSSMGDTSNIPLLSRLTLKKASVECS